MKTVGPAGCRTGTLGHVIIIRELQTRLMGLMEHL